MLAKSLRLLIKNCFFIFCLVHVFGRKDCHHCREAVSFLKECSVDFVFHDTKNITERSKVEFMMEEEGLVFHSVPQIFVCDKYVGGKSNMFAMNEVGKLEPLFDEKEIKHNKCPKTIGFANLEITKKESNREIELDEIKKQKELQVKKSNDKQFTKEELSLAREGVLRELKKREVKGRALTQEETSQVVALKQILHGLDILEEKRANNKHPVNA